MPVKDFYHDPVCTALIKSFLSPSPINDLENAWGQFFMYARLLYRKEPERRLDLAVSPIAFESLFQD